MFVERIEVLEYRLKFGVELTSTFPDFTNSVTSRKLVFSLARVCVCARLSVCAKKFVSGYLTNKLTALNENLGVYCNWPRIENLPLPVQSDRCLPKFGEGGDICNSLNPYISKTLKISKKNLVCKTSRPTNLILYIFSMYRYLTGFEIFRKKTVFEKRLSGARGSKDVLTWVKIHLKCLF